MRLKNIAAGSCARRGFTLVELSVVLAIIAVIVGMTMASGYSVISSSRMTSTNQKMAAIDQALLAFRLANDRIPCPADQTLTPSNSVGGTDTISSVTYTDNLGYEWQPCAISGAAPGSAAYNWMFFTKNLGASANQVAEGAVPVQTLGLSNDFMYDGWGNKLHYAVDVNMTYPGSFSGTPVGAVCGGITVMAGGSYPASSYRTGTSYTGAIYALISHGPNQHGAFTASGALVSVGSNNKDELTNCHCTSSAYTYTTYTATYVQAPPYTYQAYGLSNGTYNFDDIVTFKERWQMQTPGDVQGTMCPSIYTYASSWNHINKYDIRGNYLSQITGINGSGGVGFDTNGNVYVANSNAFCVEKTSQYGTTVSPFLGTCNTSGTTTTTFAYVGSVSTDNNGFLWVVDQGNNRIMKYSLAPSWLLAIPPTNSTTNASGVATGTFCVPSAAVTDAQGYLWVADTQNNRVQKFDQYGNFILQIPPATATTCPNMFNGSITSCSNGSTPACTGSNAQGQFNWPQYLAVDAAGNIWVAEDNWSTPSYNNRIQEFNASGQYINKFTITKPEGISFDSFGNLWAGNDNLVLNKCTTAGNCTAISGATACGLSVTGR